MDERFDIDNIIHKHVTTKDVWDKLDKNNVSKAFLKQISEKLQQIFSQKNLYSLNVVHQRIQKIRKYRQQLKKLRQIPIIEQRTDEWYKIRENLITASDFGDALGIEKFGKKTDPKKFYQKKCGYEEQVFDNSNIFLQWGVMFEPIATNIYESRTGVKVYEFGLIKNPRHSFLGASPDGISELGVMLEIKCPYKRVISDDSILKQYYYQMQGQLDACDLEECDFLEVKFEEYDNEESFWEDFEKEYNTYTENYREKGIVLKMHDNSYIYSPYNATKYELQDWLSNTSSKANKVIYWYLDKFSLKRVDRDPNFIHNMNIQLNDVWDNVTTYKNNPHLYDQEIRKQKIQKKTSHNKASSSSPNIVGALFIKCEDD